MMPLTARRPTQELVDIVGALSGTWSGNVAMCCCPAHSDTDPSLSIRQGDRGILVTCFAGCTREDVLRELRRVRPGQHYPQPSPARPGRPANLERIWDQARDVEGTLAERYLARRNLLPPPNDIRFHPRCPYLPKPKTLFLPALLIAVREIRKLVAIQRIFLDPQTADYIRKVMLGTPLAGAWRGGAGRGRGTEACRLRGLRDRSRLHKTQLYPMLGFPWSAASRSTCHPAYRHDASDGGGQ